ncbi:MAG: response regulator [Candidatus Rokuibacteriota bacterium]
MRVLVVEDQTDVGETLVDFLVELGHQPLLVRSAEAALGTLGTQRPDTIILDMHLPGMSGLEFLRLRPVRESGVPIVAVSGVATESQARECLRLGAIDFVAKPTPLERLKDVLAYLEPYARERRRAPQGQRANRRRSFRAAIELAVRVVEYNGSDWETASVDLSPFGIKLRAVPGVTPGHAARVAFTPADGGPELRLMSLLVRTDTAEHSFHFVNVTESEFQRLSRFVQGCPAS